MLVPTQPVHNSQLEGLEQLHNSQLEGLELYRTLHNSQLGGLELHRLYASPSWEDSKCAGLSAFTNTKDNDPLQLKQMTEKRRATTSLLKKRACLLPLPRAAVGDSLVSLLKNTGCRSVLLSHSSSHYLHFYFFWEEITGYDDASGQIPHPWKNEQM